MPRKVTACGGTYVQANVADVTVTNLAFENGVRAHVHVSWLHPFKEQRLVVIGSERMATFDDVNKELLLYDRRVEWNNGEPNPIRGKGRRVDFPATEPLQLECRAFLDSVLNRTAPLTSGRSGLRVLEVLSAAQQSQLAEGIPVELRFQSG